MKIVIKNCLKCLKRSKYMERYAMLMDQRPQYHKDVNPPKIDVQFLLK